MTMTDKMNSSVYRYSNQGWKKVIICIHQSCTSFRLLRFWYVCVNTVNASRDKVTFACFRGSIMNKFVSGKVKKILCYCNSVPHKNSGSNSTRIFKQYYSIISYKLFYSWLLSLLVKNTNKIKNAKSLIWRQSYWYWQLEFFMYPNTPLDYKIKWRLKAPPL